MMCGVAERMRNRRMSEDLSYFNKFSLIVINCINICAGGNKFIPLHQNIMGTKDKEFRRQGSRVGILSFLSAQKN